MRALKTGSVDMQRAFFGLALAVAVGVGACDFEITNPNSPPPIGPNATADQVKAAAVGTLVAVRVDVTRWLLAGAILGREGYRLDTADPRFTTELLHGPLDPSNDAFGGGQWAAEYRAIQSGYQILNVIGSAQIAAGERDAVRGFVHTIQAVAFLMVLNAHTQDSIPVDVNRSVSQPLAPLVSNDSAYKYVIGLLDSARTELLAATAFPFDPGPGFTGFNTPATFLTFNRALAARVWTYRASPAAPGVNCAACRDSAAAALAASFLNPAGSMDLGVFHVFSTGNQDTPNALFQNPASAVNLVHPFIKASAEAQNASVLLDKRFLAKVTDRKSATATVPDTFSLACLKSALAWIRYPTPNASIPIIRNEELILLDAETQWFRAAPNKAQAVADLNLIRQTSGGLAPTTVTTGSADAAFLDDLLKQRLYSLIYEGGHRWIDMRRYGRLSQVIIDRPTGCAATQDTVSDRVFTTLPINSFEVEARR